MKLKNWVGLYQLRCKPLSKKYIGCTNNLARRKGEHFYRMKAGVHINKGVQKAFDEYSLQAFVFEIIKFGKDKRKIRNEEYDLIKAYREFGVENLLFNQILSGTENLKALSGEDNGMYGKTRADEVKKALSEANEGRELDENVKKKLAEKYRDLSKSSKKDIVEIRGRSFLEDISNTYLAEIYNLSQPQVSRIIRGKRWSDISFTPIKGKHYDEQN